MDVGRVIPDENKSLVDGAIHPWQRYGPRLVREALEELAERLGFSLEVPFAQLPRRARQALLQGDATFPGVLSDLRRAAEAFLRLDASSTDEVPRPRTEAKPSTTSGPTSWRRPVRNAVAPACVRRAWPCAWASAPSPISSGFP